MYSVGSVKMLAIGAAIKSAPSKLKVLYHNTADSTTEVRQFDYSNVYSSFYGGATPSSTSDRQAIRHLSLFSDGTNDFLYGSTDNPQSSNLGYRRFLFRITGPGGVGDRVDFLKITSGTDEFLGLQALSADQVGTVYHYSGSSSEALATMHFDFANNEYSYRYLNFQYYTTNLPRYISVAASIAPVPSNPLAFQGKFVGNVMAGKTVYGPTGVGAAPFSWTFTSDSLVIDEYHSDGRTGDCGYTSTPTSSGPRTAATATAIVTDPYTGFDTSQSKYFRSDQLSLKRTSIDFCQGFVDHSKTCDSFPATTKVTAGSIAGPVEYIQDGPEVRVPFSTPFTTSCAADSEKVQIQIDDSSLNVDHSMVYYDSELDEIVVLAGQSPAIGTYSISVTGSVKSATGYVCKSFTFDLTVCGQSCPTTIETEQDVTEQLCNKNAVQLTQFLSNYELDFTVGTPFFYQLKFSDTLDGACLDSWGFQMSAPNDVLSEVPLEYEGLVIAFKSADRILIISSEQTELLQLPLSLIVYRDSGDLIQEIDFDISIHQPTASAAAEVVIDSESEPEADAQAEDDSTAGTSEQYVEIPEEIKELFEDDFEVPQKFSTEPASSSEDPRNLIWIQNITPNGIATVKFGQTVFVPAFKKDTAERRLEGQVTLQELIDKTVLLVMIDSINRYGQEDVDWEPLDFTATELTLQLKFETPLVISTISKQSLSVTVLKPYLFITRKMKFLLDGHPDYALAKEVPPQIKSEEDLKIMGSVTSAAKAVFFAAPFITLVISFVAQRALKHIWMFFAALQVISFFTGESHYQPPASTQMFFQAVTDILELKVLKDLIFDAAAEYPRAALGVAIGLGVAALLLLILAVYLYFYKCRANRWAAWRLKLRNLLFHNLWIQTFKAVFITELFKSVSSLKEGSEGVVIPIVTLLVLSLVLLVFLFLMCCRHRSYLEENRPQLGTLYLNLKTNRPGLLYCFMWFVQRVCIVLALVIVEPFSYQFVLLQLILFAKPLLFIVTKPYESLKDGVSDLANDMLLLFTHICMASLITNNVPDDNKRYDFGWAYSSLLIAIFLLNALYVTLNVLQSLRDWGLKMWRERNKKKKAKKVKEIWNKFLAQQFQLMDQIEEQNRKREEKRVNIKVSYITRGICLESMKDFGFFGNDLTPADERMKMTAFLEQLKEEQQQHERDRSAAQNQLLQSSVFNQSEISIYDEESLVQQNNELDSRLLPTQPPDTENQLVQPEEAKKRDYQFLPPLRSELMNSIGNNVNATDTGMREFTPEEYKAEAANTGMREFTPEEYKADAANTGMEEIREDSSNAKEDPQQVPVPEPENFSSDDFSVSNRMSDSYSDLASMSYDEEQAEEEEDAEPRKSDPELDEINKLRGLYVSIKDCPAESDEQLAYRLLVLDKVREFRKWSSDERKEKRRLNKFLDPNNIPYCDQTETLQEKIKRLKKEKFLDWLFNLTYPAKIRVLEEAERVMNLKQELRIQRRQRRQNAIQDEMKGLSQTFADIQITDQNTSQLLSQSDTLLELPSQHQSNVSFIDRPLSYWEIELIRKYDEEVQKIGKNQHETADGCLQIDGSQMLKRRDLGSENNDVQMQMHPQEQLRQQELQRQEQLRQQELQRQEQQRQQELQRQQEEEALGQPELQRQRAAEQERKYDQMSLQELSRLTDELALQDRENMKTYEAIKARWAPFHEQNSSILELGDLARPEPPKKPVKKQTILDSDQDIFNKYTKGMPGLDAYRQQGTFLQ